MNSFTVDFANLTQDERKQLLRLVEKSKRKLVKLSDVAIGSTFKIGEMEFVKFFDECGATVAITKDIVFNSIFGTNNNFAESDLLNRLTNEFLPHIIAEVGEDNVCEITTDLTALDGLKTYGIMSSKISLPTLDFYREYVEIFDKHKIDKWWWLATPDSAYPHTECKYVLCVSPSGCIFTSGCIFNDGGYSDISGVRPFLFFVSSIYVSCED